MRLSESKGWGGVLAWGLAFWLGGLSAGQAATKPNVVILLADDLGFADLGFQGVGDIPTPHIDSLAKHGVRCTNGYVTGPYCSPTRAGLMTGRYQQRFGHEFNPGENQGGDGVGLPTAETTLANRFKAAGYTTGLVGKWHLGAAAKFQPQRRGFDEFFGFLGGMHAYFPGQGAPIYRGTEVVQEKAYLTDAFAREAVSFVERHKADPYFLYLAFNAVHTPMDATDDRLAKFSAIQDPERRKYAAMLSAMDEAIGKVLEAIKASGQEENTLIFFHSDNGGPTMLGTTINASNNAPLRGSKRTTLEGGVHVPFVVQWKGKLPEGKTYDKPVIQLDILPTALAAAGVEVRPEWHLDGVNLLPFLNGADTGAPHDALFWRLGEQRAIRRGDWKLVRYDQALDKPGTISRAQNVTVTADRLYHLAEDLGETKDLASSHPEKVEELRKLWQAWDAELIKPLWGPGSARAAVTR